MTTVMKISGDDENENEIEIEIENEDEDGNINNDNYNDDIAVLCFRYSNAFQSYRDRP